MEKRGKRKRLKLFVFLVCSIMLVIIFFLFRNVTGVLLSFSEATVRSINAVAVNEAVNYTLSCGVSYADLVTVSYSADGSVSAITVNSLKVNELARAVAYNTQCKVTEMSAEGIFVPLGAFTGVETLAGFGPRVNVKIIPICSVDAKYISEFAQAGINQTKHSVYLNVVSDISIITPAQTRNVTASAQVLICESVITGKIPDMYLQGGGALAPR